VLVEGNTLGCGAATGNRLSKRLTFDASNAWGHVSPKNGAGGFFGSLAGLGTFASNFSTCSCSSWNLVQAQSEWRACRAQPVIDVCLGN